jgi:hypothetical protein
VNALPNWITPSVGDIVLLAKGFESKGQNTGPHYGLVVGRFKAKGSDHKFLLVAPGSSLKIGTSLDQNTQVLVKAGNVVGRDTLFYFRADLLRVYPYPSEDFVESNAVQSQANQLSATKGKLADVVNAVSSIRGYQGNMMNLYRKVLALYEISEDSLAQISPDKPVEFLK